MTKPRQVRLIRDGSQYCIELGHQIVANFCDDWLKVTGFDMPQGKNQRITITVTPVGKVMDNLPRSRGEEAVDWETPPIPPGPVPQMAAQQAERVRRERPPLGPIPARFRAYTRAYTRDQLEEQFGSRQRDWQEQILDRTREMERHQRMALEERQRHDRMRGLMAGVERALSRVHPELIRMLARRLDEAGHRMHPRDLEILIDQFVRLIEEHLNYPPRGRPDPRAG